MLSTLSILQETAEQYLSIDGKNPPATWGSVDELCNQVLSDMADIYRQLSNLDMAVHTCNRCYIVMVQLLDQCSTSSDIALPLLDALKNMMTTFELYYGHHLYSDNIISLEERSALYESVQSRLPDIISSLKKKSVPESYLHEIERAMSSLFQEGKLPELRLYHRSYLPKFVDALEHMASDHRSKDWTTRFVLLLVNYNFNHMGFYNRWEQQQELLLQQAHRQGKPKESLLHLEMELSKYNTHAHFAYCMHSKPLLDHMKDYLAVKKKIVKQEITSHQLNADSFIPLNINGNETKLFFHAGYAVDLFAPGSKEETARIIAPNLRTKAGTMLTYQSLGKYDKDKLAPQADAVIRKLKRMIKLLEDDFR